ncbi:MAG TPA: dockerin type I repeat-containing protein [Thermoanaerobaculia bacterium]|nr:dockerin type I repeat-containing protein [Thermoanaerobaculia bacterium]
MEPRLLWRGGTFHLLFAGGVSGISETEIDPAGALIGTPRAWTNRGTPAAVATNGATTALAWTQPEVFLMTDACLADTTRPPCPDVAISSVDQKIRLTWSGGGDPESGHWRTLLLRGEAAAPGSERAVAELFPGTTSLDDGGFTLGGIHTYQVLAMNGAFRLSEACPLLSYSTVRGDANGDGDVNGTDVFYLVNYFLAGGPPPQGDADANGSGGVTTGDIFYLINWLYAGGPAPEWSGETTRLAALPRRAAALSPAVLAPREALGEEATAERPRSTLALGKASARAGATIAIPVTLRDAAGTPLGRDRAAEDPIQALALSVNVLPAGAVTAIEVRRAGALAKAEPLFESRPVHASGAALVVSFDEAFAPLAISPLGAATSRTPPATTIAEVVVTLTRDLAPGTVVELRLDPATTLLSNQAGTVSETAANGWLQLSDGRIEVAR